MSSLTPTGYAACDPVACAGIDPDAGAVCVGAAGALFGIGVALALGADVLVFAAAGFAVASLTGACVEGCKMRAAFRHAERGPRGARAACAGVARERAA